MAKTTGWNKCESFSAGFPDNLCDCQQDKTKHKLRRACLVPPPRSVVTVEILHYWTHTLAPNSLISFYQPPDVYWSHISYNRRCSKKEMRNRFNRDNWDYTRLLKIYFFIIFCTCKIDTVFTRARGMKCSWLHSLPGYFFKSHVLLWL